MALVSSKILELCEQLTSWAKRFGLSVKLRLENQLGPLLNRNAKPASNPSAFSQKAIRRLEAIQESLRRDWPEWDGLPLPGANKTPSPEVARAESDQVTAEMSLDLLFPAQKTARETERKSTGGMTPPTRPAKVPAPAVALPVASTRPPQTRLDATEALFVPESGLVTRTDAAISVPATRVAGQTGNPTRPACKSKYVSMLTKLKVSPSDPLTAPEPAYAQEPAIVRSASQSSASPRPQPTLDARDEAFQFLLRRNKFLSQSINNLASQYFLDPIDAPKKT